MKYDIIYPCDLDCMGECPKRCQDCANCKGYIVPDEDWDDDEEEEEW